MYFLWALSSKAECDRWCEKPGKDLPLPHCLYLSPACKSTLLTINKHQLSQWELSSIMHLLFPPPHRRSIHLSTHSETTPRKKKKHTQQKRGCVNRSNTISKLIWQLNLPVNELGPLTSSSSPGWTLDCVQRFGASHGVFIIPSSSKKLWMLPIS